MENHVNKKLILLAGRLSNLYVENSEENFVSSDATVMAAGGAAVGLAAAGLAGAATNALVVASGGTDNVQAFTGIVDGKRLSGRFSKVWFEDGDHLECAVDPQSDGSFAVYAVRRPSDQTLWMFPHCSRGSKKHWKYAIQMCFILALTASSLLLLALMPHYGFALWENDKSYHAVMVFIIMGVLIGFYFSLKTAFRWAPFVAIAESVFTTFGYPDPAQVDLPEQDRIFRSAQNTPAEPNVHAPWVFRYTQ